MKILDDKEIKIDTALAAHGSKVYNLHCMLCHGGEVVSGGSAPDLRASPIPLSVETFNDVVHDGAFRPAGMPQFDELNARDLEGLRHFIRDEARKSLRRSLRH